MFRELDNMKNNADTDDDAHRTSEARAALRRQLNLSEEKLQREMNDGDAEQVSARPVKPGDTVKIKSMGMKATVISVSPDRVLSLRAGIMTVSAREDEVLLLENEDAPKSAKTTAKSTAQLRAASMSTEIDLRGMESIDAVIAGERFIDSAVMSRLKTVTIIHGKGTGALRNAVHSHWKRLSYIANYHLAEFGEGDAGVTIAEFK